MIKYSSDTSQGIRAQNEDYFTIIKNNEGIYLFAVADGMGGHKAGDVASKLSIKLLEKHFLLYNGDNYIEFLKDSFEQVNNEIYKQSMINAKYENMGTTLTAIIIKNTKMYIAHVGDSRAYYITDDNITQLTDDHTLVNMMLKKGEITLEQSKKSRYRNVLTQAIGTNKKIKVDLIEFELPMKYEFLICSDGLYDGLDDDQIFEILKKDKLSITDKASMLVENSILFGSKDNVTCVCIERGVNNE